MCAICIFVCAGVYVCCMYVYCMYVLYMCVNRIPYRDRRAERQWEEHVTGALVRSVRDGDGVELDGISWIVGYWMKWICAICAICARAYVCCMLLLFAH